MLLLHAKQIIRELRDEVQYLRRMLADAHEEKNIELAVVHADVAVCHRISKELRAEVQYLRKTLAHAHYERSIELTIAHGEIAEHQRLSTELRQRCNELESQMEDARLQLSTYEVYFEQGHLDTHGIIHEPLARAKHSAIEGKVAQEE